MKLIFKYINIYRGVFIPNAIYGYWIPRGGGYTCGFKIPEYKAFTKKIG